MKILTGHGVPPISFFASSTGTPMYIDLDTGIVYVASETTNTVVACGSGGAQGPQGPQGPQGATGSQGSAGSNGSNGSNGANAVLKQAVVMLPYPANKQYRVVVSDAGVGSSSKLMVSLAGLADTAVNVGDDIDILSLTAVAQAAKFEMQASFLVPHAGPFTVNYTIG